MSHLKGLQPNSSFQRVLRYTFESKYDTGCESQEIERPGQELIKTFWIDMCKEQQKQEKVVVSKW